MQLHSDSRLYSTALKRSTPPAERKRKRAADLLLLGATAASAPPSAPEGGATDEELTTEGEEVREQQTHAHTHTQMGDGAAPSVPEFKHLGCARQEFG
jgi:hypothetical protein